MTSTPYEHLLAQLDDLSALSEPQFSAATQTRRVLADAATAIRDLQEQVSTLNDQLQVLSEE